MKERAELNEKVASLKRQVDSLNYYFLDDAEVDKLYYLEVKRH